MLSRPFIVVATDFSESSDIALRAAENLRRLTNGRIHAIHVTPYPEQWDWLTNDVVINYYPDDYKKNLISELEHNLKDQLEKCQVEGDFEVLMGPTAPSVLDFISERHADLVVMCHKEKGSFLHLRGVAAKVMAGAGVPVLIANFDFEVKKVAGLVDPFHSDKKIFNAAEELCHLYSGELEFISVSPDNSFMLEESFPEGGPVVVHMTDENKKEMRERMTLTLKSTADPQTNAHFRTEISTKGSVDELVRILSEDRVELAVMAKHHKGRLEKFLLGSVTKGVLDSWNGNLLVLPT